MTFRSVIEQLTTGTINQLILLLVALALVYFFWGVVKYIGQTDNEGAREDARNIMINGLLALFIMMSVWGIIQLLVNSFPGLGASTLQQIPYRQ